MSENHGINLNINAANAKRGANEYVAAINAISSATLKYKKAMDSVNSKSTKVDFGKMARDLNTLSSIRVNSNNTRAINDLSAAMRNFRGPSSGAIKQTRDFFRVLNSSQVNGSLARQVAAIGTSLATFRAPSRAQANAVQALISALGGGGRLNPRTAGDIAAIATSLAGFRGPTTNAVRNINGLVDALNRLRNPPDLSRLAQSLTAISAASMSANRNVNALTQSHNRHTTSARNAGGATLQLTGNMRGLENAFSASYHAGSMLRTLFGALTLSEFTRGVYDASIQTQKFQTTLGVTEKTMAGVQAEMNYATGVADKYGISIAGVYEEYAKFSTAAKLAGQTTDQVRYIFESVSGAMRVMGTDTQGQARVFRALTQMFSKGAVRAEELVQQIGEQIPGAFQVMQDALSEKLGKKVDLAKMLELGQVDDSAVILFAKKLTEIFGPQVATAMERVDAQLGRLQNSWFKFQEAIGSGGVNDAIADVADKIAGIMNGPEFKGQAAAISKALADAIRGIGDAAIWAMTHTKEVASALAGLLAMNVASRIAGIVSTVASMASSFGLAGLALGAIPVAIGAATAALAYYWNDMVTVGDTTASVGAIATQVWNDIKSAANQAWEAMKNFSFDGMISAFTNFDLVAFTTFETVDKNSRIAAKNTSTVWEKVFKLMVVWAADMYAKVGSSFEKLIVYGKEYGKALASTMNPWDGRSNDQIWLDMTIAAKSQFAEIEKGTKDFHDNVVKELGLASTDMEAGITGLVKSELEKYVERAAQADKSAKDAAAKLEGLRLNTFGPEGGLTQPKPSMPTIDTSAVNPIKEAASSTKNDPVAKRLKEAQDATVAYKAEVLALLQQLQAGKITIDQYNRGLEFQAQKLQEVKDPYAAMTRTMQDEINLSGMATRAREIEVQLREKTNALMEKGVTLTAAQTAELRKLIETQQSMNDRPLKEWVDGIESVGVATDRVAVTSIQGLNDQIAEMVVTGKADFASLAQSILKDFIKVGLEQTEKQLFAPFFGGTQTAPAPGTVATPAANVTAATFNSVDLRGTLSTLQTSATTTAPALDAVRTGAINAAAALNQLAGNKVAAPLSTPGATQNNALNQPMPAAVNAYQPTQAANLAAVSTPAVVAAQPYNAQSKTLTLTPQEVVDLKKTLATEVDGRLSPAAFDAQAAGVTDTILNRKVSGNWGDSVTSVVDAKSQFSNINGPVAWKENRTSVSQLPDTMLDSGNGLRSSQFVDAYLAKRMNGTPSSVDGNLSYANPNYADPKNQAWINQMNGPVLGEGSMVHKHGTPDGMTPVDPSYKIAMAQQNTTATALQSSPSSYIQNRNLNWDGRMMDSVQGITFHHTGGRGTPDGVVNTLNERGFGAQYIMDRDGTITQTVPDMARVSHMKNDEQGLGLNNSNMLGIEMIGKNDADITDAQKASGLKFIEDMKAKYPTIGENIYGHGELNSHKQETEGMAVVNAYRQQRSQTQQAVDPQVTGSIDSLNQKLKDTGTAAQTAATQTQTAQTQVTTATQAKIAADQQAGISVQTAGQQTQSAATQFQTAGQQIQTAGTTAQQATPGVQGMSQGLSGLMGPLSSVVPGLSTFGSSIMGLLGSLGSPTAGLFREGGIATDPVAVGKMPAFAEGTANTGSYGRGGIPSILHPNEAVIPLSRGRSVPVEMNGPSEREPSEYQRRRGAGGGSPTFNLNLSGIKSADDFKKSQRQIKSELASAYQRSQRRA